MMSGGAPLSPSTHEYLRAVLGVDLLQVIVVNVTLVVVSGIIVMAHMSFGSNRDPFPRQFQQIAINQGFNVSIPSIRVTV